MVGGSVDTIVIWYFFAEEISKVVNGTKKFASERPLKFLAAGLGACGREENFPRELHKTVRYQARKSETTSMQISLVQRNAKSFRSIFIAQTSGERQIILWVICDVDFEELAKSLVRHAARFQAPCFPGGSCGSLRTLPW